MQKSDFSPLLLRLFSILYESQRPLETPNFSSILRKRCSQVSLLLFSILTELPCKSAVKTSILTSKIKEDQVDRAVLNVRNLDYAMTQFALTTMRNIVGQFELDELLAKREEAASKIKEIVDEKSDAWGVDVLSVELKDINLPDDLKRTIGKQAEAEREKRAKIITSEGELASAENLRKAATMLAEAPGALHLRTLQSINDISSDESNTTIRMVPVEILEAIKGIGSSFSKKA